MRYRSGYSRKDKGQERILALRMKHEHFHHLLSLASVTSQGRLADEDKSKPVRVQWDPERSTTLEQLPYRSIQIGISNQLIKKWVDEWIISIDDVTERAVALEKAVRESEKLPLEKLISMDLAPEEKEYIVPQDLRRTLGMDGRAENSDPKSTT